jgi:hypothetical protein
MRMLAAGLVEGSYLIAYQLRQNVFFKHILTIRKLAAGLV